jgi:hypothetical protein
MNEKHINKYFYKLVVFFRALVKYLPFLKERKIKFLIFFYNYIYYWVFYPIVLLNSIINFYYFFKTAYNCGLGGVVYLSLYYITVHYLLFKSILLKSKFVNLIMPIILYIIMVIEYIVLKITGLIKYIMSNPFRIALESIVPVRIFKSMYLFYF